MEKTIYDESNGLWYELRGDYYIPCLTVPAQEEKPIGIWQGKRSPAACQQLRVQGLVLLFDVSQVTLPPTSMSKQRSKCSC